MPVGLADLLHDAAVLHRFVDFIEEYCREQERSQTYADASGLFFAYVERLAIGIKAELCGEIERATRFPARLPNLRLKMLTLKYYLRQLHALVKPAADAHTLTTPAPLIDLASQQLQQVAGMKGSTIVILLTPELMYFQRPHTEIKDHARIVESFIPGATFPAKLGFIELPYSQGPSFFTNLAIYHEIGHFVYEELSNLDTPTPEIARLRSVTTRSLGGAFKGTKDRQTFAIGKKILENWTQEIFCDLFAIHLLGPAFSFALVEILGMLGFLSRSSSVKFNPTHPASACRFAEHITLLSTGGSDSWLQAIAETKPEQKKLLIRLANLPRSAYTLYLDDKTRGPRSLVDAFLDEVVPAIRDLASHVTQKAIPSVKSFVRSRADIDECLRVGVVPLQNSSRSPDAVSIINAAFCFYLTSLTEAVQRFEGAEAVHDVALHSLWSKRLEMWTTKAIEDSQIQARFRKAVRYGPL
jgi:hypothetical protein